METINDSLTTVTSSHPLADYLDNNHPFSGLSEQMNSVTNEIEEGMNEKLFDRGRISIFTVKYNELRG